MKLKFLKTAAMVLMAAVFPVWAALAQEATQEAIEYKTVSTDETSSNVGILYKRTPQGLTVEVSTITTGKGANFRDWESSDVKLDINGNMIKPDKVEKFYVSKTSFFQGPAVLLFAAIGSQYEQYSDEAQSGGVCPVTGQETAGRKRGSIARGIDKAGMAAGMGLLASQAKGDIRGYKYTFNLDNDTAMQIDGQNGLIAMSLDNDKEHKQKKVKVPLSKCPEEEQPRVRDARTKLEDAQKHYQQENEALRQKESELNKAKGEYENIKGAREKLDKEISDLIKKIDTEKAKVKGLGWKTTSPEQELINYYNKQMNELMQKSREMRKTEKSKQKEVEALEKKLNLNEFRKKTIEAENKVKENQNGLEKAQKECKAEKQAAEEKARIEREEEQRKEKEKEQEKDARRQWDIEREKLEKQAQDDAKRSEQLQRKEDMKTFELYKRLGYDLYDRRRREISPKEKEEVPSWFKTAIKDMLKRIAGEIAPSPIPDETFDALYETYNIMANVYDPQSDIGYRKAFDKVKEMVKEEFPGLDEDQVETETMRRIDRLQDLTNRIESGEFSPPRSR